MRLLVGARIYQALNSIRRATTHPVSYSPVAMKYAPKLSIKYAAEITAPAASLTKRRSKIAPAATVAAATATPEVSSSKSRSEQLQQLWELNKDTEEGVEPLTKREVRELKEGGLPFQGKLSWHIVKRLSDSLEFASIEKLLKMDPRFEFEEGKIPNVRLVNDVLWAAVLAKSLGSLAPSILDWIEEAVRRIPEPNPVQKESMMWLLSILRDDLPMLLRLQQESCSNGGRIGPEIDREEILRHAALAFLPSLKRGRPMKLRKTDEFRSLWTSSGTPLLAEQEEQLPAALLHHALMRSSSSGKKDPAMLRWYAESLVSYQRTPIPAEPQFETMMLPVITALGGKIEKWRDNDWRIQKLRKWRDDYDDTELDKLVHSMIDDVGRQIALKEYGSREDLSSLGKMLTQIGLTNEDKKGSIVVVDWLNLSPKMRERIDNLLPSHSLVIVGREKCGPGDLTPQLPNESNRVKVMELKGKRERKTELDIFCVLLVVATRGYLLTNDMTRGYDKHFVYHLKTESRDVFHSTLLKNYLNDATLRHHCGKIQPMVDHSKAAQWIDKEKKKLAFSVARKIPSKFNTSFREIEYYCLHID